MKTPSKITPSFFLNFLLILVISGGVVSCSQQPVRATSVQDAQVPVVTQTATTPPPTITPTQTMTPSVTPSQTLTPLPTLTLLPTLSQNEIMQEVKKLVETNGGCNLPCWWGITPGETTWAEAKNFFLQFNQEIPSTKPSEVMINGQIRVTTDYSLILHSPGNNNEMGAIVNVLDETDIAIIQTYGEAENNSYTLDNLLGKYGMPEEIFVESVGNAPGGILPFYVLLYYPDQNFFAVYDLLGTRQGETVTGCPKSKKPTLWMWSQEESERVDAERVQQWATGIGNRINFLGLQDATGLNIETFYEMFNEKNNSCLQTPAKLWPYY